MRKTPRNIYAVFSIWKTLRVIEKACMKILACAIYTYLFFLYIRTPLICWKIKSCCDHCFLQQIRPQTTHLAVRRRDDVATTSLCTSQRLRRYSQIKHPTRSRWNVAKTSQWYFSTTSHWNIVTTSQKDVTTMPHHYVSSTSQTSLKWNTQRRFSSTLPRRLSGAYLRRPISTSLRRLL